MASHLARIRLLDEIAKFISTIFSPLLTPSYGLFMALSISPKVLDPTGVRIKLLIIILGITCVLPMATIAVLHNFKLIKDKRMLKREERLIPYITGTIYYGIAVWYMVYTHEPKWLIMYAVGGTLACLISTLVNIKWKISAHMAGMGGVLALLWQLDAMDLEVISPVWMMFFILVTIGLCGVLGTARLLLKRHDILQILAGFFNGVVCVSLMMRLFG
ncbi:MAG: hypothetical protein IJR20_02405 [Muribaculaceae bacterium]|nr:hypothetical protein [Muribaculaceae bacterium]